MYELIKYVHIRPPSAAGLWIVGRLFRVARAELVECLVIIALMVTKPNIG